MQYSIDELFQCIFECMTESLPNGWKSASLHASVAEDAVNSTFHFRLEDGGEPIEYMPDNTIAPLNAVIELQKIARSEGQSWSTIDIDVSSDGQLTIHTS
jgi:hypothetical protein